MDIRPNVLPPSGFGFRGGDGPLRGAVVRHVDGGGPGALAWVIFALVLALLLLTIASLVLDDYRSRAGRPSAQSAPGPPGSTRALTVLDDRYARGEISRDDYLRARDDLRGLDAPTEVIRAQPEPDPV
ncbi:MAG TPA: SHOCT domain-containing protein [Gaiellaceae bacterium]|nr:SHOCT domain-containing protein [Gaiellaceae bacterium]